MKAEYKNWVPNGMIYGLGAVTVGCASAMVCADLLLKEKPITRNCVKAVMGTGAVVGGAFTAWSIIAHSAFSYEGSRQLAKQIVEGTAEYVQICDGGIGLDVGCGSGALTIACAKSNPNAKMVGVDRWGKEYASFSKELCENNAKAEGVTNTTFETGNAIHLDYPDETFDAVTSNYVYHNITAVNKQKLLKETLRVLKKGGTFAIHDIMSRQRYGDMEKFVNELKQQGYEDVRLIPTDNGLFMSDTEAAVLMLRGSALLVGKK